METPRIRLHVRIRPEIPRTTPHDHRRATVPIRIRHHHPKRNRSQRRRITSMHPGRRTIRHRLRTHAHQRGIGVIAGLAKGIDTFAHKRARGRGGEPSRSSAPASTVSTRRRTATCRNASKTKGSCCPSSCRAPNRPDRRSRCVTRSCPAMASPPSSPTRTNTPHSHTGSAGPEARPPGHPQPYGHGRHAMGPRTGRQAGSIRGEGRVRGLCALDYIMSIDDVDMLARQLLDAAPAAI